MTSFSVVVADPPWRFGDKLTMSKTKRGAASNYSTMSFGDIASLGVQLDPLLAKDCLLALWVPASMIEDGTHVVRAWGFKQKQVYTWVKATKDSSGLAFGMGRQFRGATEHALIGTRGSPKPANRAMRNVELHSALPHSQKPEVLQDALDLMYPDCWKLEMFARRERHEWVCVGNECPTTKGVDIRDWLEEAAK